MKRTLYLLTGIIIIALSFTHANGEDWRFYAQYNDFFYYDKESIKHPYEDSQHILGVWQKVIYDKESLMRIAEHLGDKYNDLSESISLIEINCYTKQAQTKSTTRYDSKGKIIETSNVIRPDWKKIPDLSPFEKLYQHICLTRKPQKK